MIAAALIASLAGAADLPNLVVQSITFDPPVPSVGHVVTVNAVLRNAGPGTVDSAFCFGGDIRVAYFVDGAPAGIETLACGLDPDESDPETHAVVFTTPGEHIVRVVVDSDQSYEEASEEDNALEQAVTVAFPAVQITSTIPSIGAPGQQAVPITVSVKNLSEAELEDVWVELRFDDEPVVDFGWAQDSDIDPGQTVTFAGSTDLGTTSADGAFRPGAHEWSLVLRSGGLSSVVESYPIVTERVIPITLVDTVVVNADNIVIPVVEPAVTAMGPVTTFTATELVVEGASFSAALDFALAVDPMADGSAVVLPAVVAADVYDADGAPVCDPAKRREVLLGLLVWRDLIVEHPWYQGTYVALQEGFDWYQNENHLQVAYYITQPFVFVGELIDDLFQAGKGLAVWLGQEVGFLDETEARVGEETLAAVTRITKGYEALDDVSRALMKASPLLQGEPYLSDHVVTERLILAIEEEGQRLDEAVDLVHDVIAKTSPESYTSIASILKKELILKAVKKALTKGVKTVLWTAVKRGFTAYFIAQLTAKTALKVAIGEGSAALMASLGAAGIAKGIASLGITLLIDASIAYLSYVGTYVNNVRGQGGLCESGRVVAQSVPWTHVEYRPDGQGGALDLDVAVHTFLSHAAMIELYGFVNADLATLKKLAFAFDQSDDYKAEAEGLFAVAKTQRDLAVAIEAVIAAVPSPACDAPSLPVDAPSYRAPPGVAGEPPPPAPRARWTKRPEAVVAPIILPVARPGNDPDGPEPTPAEDVGPVTPGELPAETATGCDAAREPASSAWVLGLALLLIAVRRVRAGR